MKKLIMIKYGELTTKKANRNTFISLLTKNIKYQLRNYEIRIHKDRVRMYIEVLDNQFDEVVQELQKVFGLHGIVICYQVHTNIDTIKENVLKILEEKNGKTFKVNTKRADKRFSIPSMEFNNVIGGHVLKNTNLKVDVHHPDILIHIEIRPEGTFLYTNEIKGIGGYPVGIQGKGLLMLSGGIDSPVAGYLALKRGVDLECIYFESLPHTSMEARNKVLDLAKIINQYSGNIKVHIIPFTKIQEAIYKNCDEDYIITIMRRMMYRISEQLAKRKKCKVLINGESIGQVASQTLDSMQVINAVTNIPVIRPVSCMDKLEIIDLSKKIGAYETSILPFEDCCTIFLPKHPVIYPRIEKCIEMETRFCFDEMIEECLEQVITVSNLEIEVQNDLL